MDAESVGRTSNLMGQRTERDLKNWLVARSRKSEQVKEAHRERIREDNVFANVGQFAPFRIWQGENYLTFIGTPNHLTNFSPVRRSPTKPI